MGRACNGYRVLLGWLALTLLGCDELDPVYTDDMCGEGPDRISIHCRRCQAPPFAAACPQCRNGSSDQCLPPDTSTSPSMTMTDASSTPPNGGSGDPPGPDGSGGKGDAQSGNNAAPSGGNGQPAAGGNNPPGGGNGGPNNPPGSGAQAPNAGTGGTPRPPGCGSDEECAPGGKVCRPDRICVDCYDDRHCTSPLLCSKVSYMCVGCRSNGDCKDAAKPVCDPASQTCVACLNDSTCSAPLGTCNLKHECVDCKGARDGCTDPALPACLEAEEKCVECLNDTHCMREPNRHCDLEKHVCVQCNERIGDCTVPNAPYCIEEEHRCVRCLENEHCDDPQYSRCGPDNLCGGCNSNAECERFPDTPVCDVPAHRCVECITSAQCGATACIKATHECGTVRRNTVGPCKPCKATDECMGGYDCMHMTFGTSGVDIGDFCLPQRGSFGSSTCTRPWPQALDNRTTIEGDRRSLCAPAPTTTCPAFLKAQEATACTLDSDCAESSTDGQCIETSSRCTYPCRTANDCPHGQICENNVRCNIPPATPPAP